MRITGMTCASCSNALEKALGAVGGVQSASVSLSLEQAEVTFDPGLATEVCVLARHPAALLAADSRLASHPVASWTDAGHVAAGCCLVPTFSLSPLHHAGGKG